MTNYLSFAKRNLKRRGVRSWLTLIGIIIGVIAVVSLISLSSGLKVAVNSQFGVSSTQLITVQAGGLSGGPPGSFVANPLKEDLIEEIEKINSVGYAIGRDIETLKVSYNGETEYIPAMSIPENRQEEVHEAVELEVEQGDITLDNKEDIFLGNNFLREDNDFSKKIEARDNLEINEKKFRVSGILKKKGSFIFDNIIGIREDGLRDIVPNPEKTVDAIVVKVKDQDLMDKAKEDIEELLRDERGVAEGEEDFTVETPEAALEQVNEILNGIQIFIVIVASISILVGGIGIVNTMTTSVLERRKEIGIMKSIGAKNKQIFNQFLVESGLLGLVGGVIGVVIGTAIGYFGTLGINSFFGTTAAPNINFILIISALIGSFLIGAVAGISPALKAAKQNPVEAIRG